MEYCDLHPEGNLARVQGWLSKVCLIVLSFGCSWLATLSLALAGPNVLQTPNVNPRGSVFPPSAQEQRARHTQHNLATGQAPLADPGQQVKVGDWRLKINNSAIAHGDIVLLGEIAQPLGNVSNWVNLL